MLLSGYDCVCVRSDWPRRSASLTQSSPPLQFGCRESRVSVDSVVDIHTGTACSAAQLQPALYRNTFYLLLINNNLNIDNFRRILDFDAETGSRSGLDLFQRLDPDPSKTTGSINLDIEDKR